MKQHRIWELDALRGICILLVIGLHLMFDLQLPLLQQPAMVVFNAAVGIAFVVLSGLSITLGHHPVRRGLQVFGCAMVITLVTWAMAKLGFLHPNLIIRFGVLHLLGICMTLWPLFRKLPTWVLAALGAIILALGYWFKTLTVEIGWLFPLGLMSPGFSSGDYFPLAPFLGWFFLGAVLGRKIYGKKQSIFANFSKFFAFFCFLGRHSLMIYLLHQPILYVFILLLA